MVDMPHSIPCSAGKRQIDASLFLLLANLFGVMSDQNQIKTIESRHL